MEAVEAAAVIALSQKMTATVSVVKRSVKTSVRRCVWCVGLVGLVGLLATKDPRAAVALMELRVSVVTKEPRASVDLKEPRAAVA